RPERINGLGTGVSIDVQQRHTRAACYQALRRRIPKTRRTARDDSSHLADLHACSSSAKESDRRLGGASCAFSPTGRGYIAPPVDEGHFAVQPAFLFSRNADSPSFASPPARSFASKRDVS